MITQSAPVQVTFPIVSSGREDVVLESSCRLFLQSDFYRKAIEDAGYERLQAISDFLTERYSGPERPFAPEEVRALALKIRASYFRYF